MPYASGRVGSLLAEQLPQPPFEGFNMRSSQNATAATTKVMAMMSCHMILGL